MVGFGEIESFIAEFAKIMPSGKPYPSGALVYTHTEDIIGVYMKVWKSMYESFNFICIFIFFIFFALLAFSRYATNWKKEL